MGVLVNDVAGRFTGALDPEKHAAGDRTPSWYRPTA
jgi:hypothetical protein